MYSHDQPTKQTKKANKHIPDAPCMEYLSALTIHLRIIKAKCRYINIPFVPWSICARVDQLLILGDKLIPPFIEIGNPYNGYINPYWVDGHHLLLWEIVGVKGNSSSQLFFLQNICISYPWILFWTLKHWGSFFHLETGEIMGVDQPLSHIWDVSPGHIVTICSLISSTFSAISKS